MIIINMLINSLLHVVQFCFRICLLFIFVRMYVVFFDATITW